MEEYEAFVESLLIVKETVRLLIKDASKIIAEKHILSQMPQIGYDWFSEQITVIMKKHNLAHDDYEDAMYSDGEPTPVNIENWRRFQGQFMSKSPPQSPLKRSETKKYTKISLAQTQRKSDVYETQLVQMGELDDDIEFDPNIESIRQAKLRQISIQQQKQQNDKVKIQEVQEQARQLKRLNVDAKSKYTYDFEGKVVIQKAPDIERYPKSHQSVYEKRTLVEVRDLLPNRKLEQELIPSGKKQSLIIGQANQFTVKTSVPQIDLIIMKEGVSFFDGKSEKKKERQLPLMEIKDATVLQTKLHDSSVHMTKSEYQVVTNTQQPNNYQNKTLQLSMSEQQLPQTKTSRTFQEEKQYINGDSLLSYRQPKTTINQSISSSILHKLNGSISILSEQQLEELLQSQTTQEHPLFGKKQTKENLRKPSSVQPIKIELPQIPPNVISNSVSKLPKIYSISGAFPKLLAKYPRERVSKRVFSIKTNL